MRALARSGRDVIAVHWLCERIVGLLQWAAIAAALAAGALGVLRAAGLARFGGGGG